MTELGSHRREVTNRGQRKPSVSQDSEGAEAALLTVDPDFPQVPQVQTGSDRMLDPGLA